MSRLSNSKHFTTHLRPTITHRHAGLWFMVSHSTVTNKLFATTRRRPPPAWVSIRIAGSQLAEEVHYRPSIHSVSRIHMDLPAYMMWNLEVRLCREQSVGFCAIQIVHPEHLCAIDHASVSDAAKLHAIWVCISLNQKPISPERDYWWFKDKNVHAKSNMEY